MFWHQAKGELTLTSNFPDSGRSARPAFFLCETESFLVFMVGDWDKDPRRALQKIRDCKISRTAQKLRLCQTRIIWLKFCKKPYFSTRSFTTPIREILSVCSSTLPASILLQILLSNGNKYQYHIKHVHKKSSFFFTDLHLLGVELRNSKAKMRTSAPE